MWGRHSDRLAAPETSTSITSVTPSEAVGAVWVLDVGGRQVLIVAQHFPGTSAKTVAQLRQMVDSIRFTSQ
jgi:hypothetical protein